LKEGQRHWSRDELVLAMNLYCKLPFGRLHQRNPEIIRLAKLIDRTPGSVAYKLVNFASLDPSLKKRGIKGASNASKLDKEVWAEFYNNWGDMPFESEKLRAKYEQVSLEELNQIAEDVVPAFGRTREVTVKARVNQSFFRSTILAAYNNRCCVTGLQKAELLVAGHIKPWSVDEANRLNPRNGICINALHDKAFEAGFITITEELKLRVSSLLFKDDSNINSTLFLKYDGKPIHLPTRFLPDPLFLRYHNKSRFKK